MSFKSNIKRGKIIIDPTKNHGATIYFDPSFFTSPPSVILTPNDYVITYLEETTINHFSFRINSSLTENITINYVAIERLTYEESTAMSRDFLATRNRTERIIGTGSTQKLIVYSDSNATDVIGGVSQTLKNKLDALGNEVYFYIDGIPDGKKNSTVSSVVSFGGDVVIAGKLYADTVITTGESSSLWGLDADSNLTMSGILDNVNGAFSISFLEDIAYTISSRNDISINDTYFEFDASGNVMPKLAS